MEKNETKFPRLNLGNLIIAVALGIILAVGLYQARIQGLIPLRKEGEPLIQRQENRVIIQEENAVISAVDEVSPSVVAIGVSRRVINPFDPFSVPRTEDSTIGTGFVVSDKGLIVTNKHVVSDTSGKYTVVTKDDKKYEVTKIYRDPLLDLAIVQVSNGIDLKPVELGNSSKLKVGQTVIAIGNALGRFTNTVTTGVVSGLGRAVVAGTSFYGSYERLDDLIQTDAAINPGNSGGPLLNSKGQVIGVNVAVTEGAQNIGFAIPIDAVKAVVDEFIEKGTISRPYVGIRYQFITRDVAILNELPQGAYVRELVKNGPAEKAGVRVGDVVTKMNGQSIDKDTKISEIVSKSSVGSKIDITVWRDGRELNFTAILEDLPSE